MSPGGVAGVQALVSGSIPPSAGLSSSSAVVVSGALVTVWASGVTMDREQLATPRDTRCRPAPPRPAQR